MVNQDTLFIENLKTAMNDQFKNDNHYNRNITIINIEQTDKDKFLVTAKATFTNIHFLGVNQKGDYEVKTDAHFIIQTELNSNNAPIKRISPFTIQMDFSGDYDVKQITKQQFFNVQIIKDNTIFNNMTDQEKIDYCIEQHPSQDIIQNKKATTIEPFTIQIIHAEKKETLN